MNQKTIKTEKTKQNILNVSKVLFRENGYDKTTTRMISSELGMSTGSIFVHYKTKQDILINILYTEIDKAIGKGFKKSELEVDLDSKILKIFEPVFKFYFKEVEFSRELLKGALFERQEILLKQVHSFNSRLEGLIKTSLETGEINTRKDPYIISRIIFSCYFNILLKEVCYEETPSTRRAITELEEIFNVIF
jgi:AcrR family transcriptional regulator